MERVITSQYKVRVVEGYIYYLNKATANTHYKGFRNLHLHAKCFNETLYRKWNL